MMSVTGMILRCDPVLRGDVEPIQHVIVNHFRTEIWPKLTAASSGRRAPLAILCLPGLSLDDLLARFFTDPSLASSRARHSSSVT